MTTFDEQAQTVFESFTAEERGSITGVDVLDTTCPNPYLPGHWILSELANEPGEPPRIRVYQASFQRVAERNADFSSEANLREEIVRQASRFHEDLACASQYGSDDAVIAAHASFREGEPLLPGWYRQGAEIQPYAWAVDTDVFLELPLRQAEFETLRGSSVVLKLPGADMELDVPDDAAADETWQIEGGGLFEEDPDIDLESLEEDDEVTGTFGDLHIVLVVSAAPA